MIMNRIQFYPSQALADILNAEAAANGVSVSKFVVDLLDGYYNLSASTPSVTHLTAVVLGEIEDFLKAHEGESVIFDLNDASPTYRNIPMAAKLKPSTVRASIGRSFAGKIGKPPFANVKKYQVNGVQQLSVNNALIYIVLPGDGAGR